jgi:large subunit ribosomal protein L17
MRHQKHHASLGVTREHREAMLSNLAASLIKHGRIQTTLAKARALRPFIEKIITKAKRASAATGSAALHQRRLALRDVRDEDAITLLFNDKVSQFASRAGGYTRIYKLGARRVSDAAELALIEFVAAEDTGYKKSKGRKSAKRRKSAAKVEAPVETAAEAPAEAAVEAAPEAEPEAPAAEGEAPQS